MTTLRQRAIEHSDKLWPDYGDGASHALSGGFIDGAVWADQAPAGDLEAELLRRFPVAEDRIEELITDRWRRGFRQGAEWVREGGAASAPEQSSSDPIASLPQLYLGFIFNPVHSEGIEGEAVVHTDLDSLRAILKAAVDEANLEIFDEPEPFGWAADGETYWPDANLRYGGFAWARLLPVTPGFRHRVSEYS